MDRSVKLTLAASVVIAGAVISLPFRRGPQRENLPSAEGERLVLRERIAPQSSIASSGTVSGSALNQPVQAARPVTILTPANSQEKSRLPKSTADSSRLTTRWGASLLLGVPDHSPKTIHHRISDGDTLPSLAERYLGSADRQREIYEANRDVLKSPDLLPIGVELKIRVGNGENAER